MIDEPHLGPGKFGQDDQTHMNVPVGKVIEQFTIDCIPYAIVDMAEALADQPYILEVSGRYQATVTGVIIGQSDNIEMLRQKLTDRVKANVIDDLDKTNKRRRSLIRWQHRMLTHNSVEPFPKDWTDE